LKERDRWPGKYLHDITQAHTHMTYIGLLYKYTFARLAEYTFDTTHCVILFLIRLRNKICILFMQCLYWNACAYVRACVCVQRGHLTGRFLDALRDIILVV